MYGEADTDVRNGVRLVFDVVSMARSAPAQLLVLEMVARTGSGSLFFASPSSFVNKSYVGLCVPQCGSAFEQRNRRVAIAVGAAF